MSTFWIVICLHCWVCLWNVSGQIVEEVPPTELAPTELPPTELPPTELAPTELPLTELAPTELPLTELPLTERPLTEVAPTELPLTELPPTELPPTTPAPIDGGFSEWQESVCSVSCGVGEKQFSRTCTEPEPKHNGKQCVGQASKTEVCNEQPCPVDGGFSEWKEGACSKSCGGGEKGFTRTCTNPEPKNGGKQCVGETSKTEGGCNEQPCPIDGGFSEWKEGACSKSCGGGEKTFTRTCTNPEPKNGGKQCAGQASKTEGGCNEQPCPIDGGFSDWKEGACSKACGGGEKQFTRTCTNPEPKNNGKQCVGQTSKTEGECNKQACAGVSCSMTLDIIIILDSSGSVGRHIWPQEVEFAKSLVKMLSVSQQNTHVGVIDFSSRSIVRVDMNKPEGYTPASIQQTLDNLKNQFQSGITYTDLALASAVKMYNEVPANRHAPKLLIIVTDGGATPRDSQTGKELMRDEIEALKTLNVNRIAIGVGSNVKRNELDFIASYRGNVILVSTFEALLNDISGILNALCKPPGDIEGCPQIIDLVVVLDCSGSIGYWNWQRQLNFVRQLVQNFKISQQQTRIGLVVFHENVKVYIDITKEGSSKDQILSKLSQLKGLWEPYMRTYTDLALNSAVQVVEQCRKHIPKLVLLVTDGETSFWRKPLLVKPVETLYSNGVEIYSVGVGARINDQELLYMSKKKERVFMIKNYKELIKHINKILKKLCEIK